MNPLMTSPSRPRAGDESSWPGDESTGDESARGQIDHIPSETFGTDVNLCFVRFIAALFFNADQITLHARKFPI